MNGRIFFKVDVLAIREAGLISKIGANGWATLCAIAAFMDEDGVCYPTQETLADLMGVSRQAANVRVGRLLGVTMEDGSPLLERSWMGYGLNKRSVYRVNKSCGVLMGREQKDSTLINAKPANVKDRRQSQPVRSQDSLTSNVTITDVTPRNVSGHKEEPVFKEEPIKEEPADIDLDELWKELYGK